MTCENCFFELNKKTGMVFQMIILAFFLCYDCFYKHHTTFFEDVFPINQYSSKFSENAAPSFSSKQENPLKYKNAKKINTEDKENEAILKRIKNNGNEMGLLKKEIKQFEIDEFKRKIHGEDKFNVICWMFRLKKCHKDKPLHNLNSEENAEYKTAKHNRFLNRKFII